MTNTTWTRPDQLPLSLKLLTISYAGFETPNINPYAPQANAQIEQFAAQYQFALPNLKSVITMADYLYPQADLHTLVTIGMMMSLLFYMDDVYGDLHDAQSLDATVSDEVSSVTKGVLQVFNDERNPRTPLETAFMVVRERMIDHNPPAAWFQRFNRSLNDHLSSAIDPAAYTSGTIGDPVERYIQTRVHVSGMLPTVNLVELANNQYLPDDSRLHHDFQRVLRGSSRIPALTNDLFSYEKEVITSGLTINLVYVIQQTFGLDMIDALCAAIDTINQETAAYLSAVRRVEEQNILPTAYTAGLKYQIGATWHWQLATSRYRSPTSPFIELRA